MAVFSTIKGNSRREGIIKASTQLIAKYGVGDFTFEALAKVLKVSPPHVRYYFPTKRDLFLACFESVAERGQAETVAKLESAHDWQARLRAVVEGAFSWYQKSPSDMTILFIFYHYASLDSKLARAHAETREIGRKRIEGILWAGLSEEITKAEAYEYSVEIQSLITGLIVELATVSSTHVQRHYKSALSAVERIVQFRRRSK